MEEGLIEIDPELYMTCRLCVEQKGKFQILPNLQKRIKFAFDIDIQLFDGFSQIMCEKCKALVMEMGAMKEKFQAKQAALRNGNVKLSKVDDDVTEVIDVEVLPVELKKVEERPVAQLEQNGKSDSDKAPSHSSKSSASSKKKKKLKKAKKKALRSLSSSSSEIEAAKRPRSKSKQPMRSESKQPEQCEPVQPMRSKPKQPTQSESESKQPVQCEPVQPMRSKPKQPTQSESESKQPVQCEPVQPMRSKPKQPTQSESEQDIVDVDNVEPTTHSWKELYYRSYVCRYCNQILSFKKSMKDHAQKNHPRLVRKRHKVARWHSIVKMERFDERPNLTGNDNIVVFSQKKLCSNDENADYYILYTPKGIEAGCALNPPDPTYVDPNFQNLLCSDTESRSNRKRFMCIDVTSEDEETHQPKLRKRIRLQSSSSSDTVDLQNDAQQNSDVEDSLHSMCEPLSEIQHNKEQPLPTNGTENQKIDLLPDLNSTIKKIVSASLENIKKKQSHINTQKTCLSIDELTKRKLLSVGRKTMVKQGIVSMGLLKVLEQRDIKIQWVKDSKSKDSFVRIFTKVSDDTTDKLMGFQPCVDMGDGIKETDAEKSLRMAPWLNPSKNVKTKTPAKLKSKVSMPPMPLVVTPLIPSAATVQPSLSSMSPLLPTLAPLLPLVTPLLPALPHTTLTRNTPVSVAAAATVNTASPQLLNILNANPVPNPKKAPKKKTSLLKTELLRHITQNDHDYNGEPITLDSDEDITDSSRKALNMPSISPKDTSRTDSPKPNISPKDASQKDLSMPNDMPNVSPKSNPNYPASSTPSTTKSYGSRTLIVSSSASMCLPIITATTSLANISQENPIKNAQEEKSESLSVPRIKCKPVSELMGNKIMTDTIVAANDISKVLANRGDTESAPALPSNIPPGNIVLHTITLPNTVTKSPFDYFSRLLRMHTMYLLDSLSHTEVEFATLVKFKLGVHQHPLSVMLCLTLEANGSMFRISIKNKANEDVDVASMTALWQWEVLKAFNSESVITRIKQAAEREPNITLTRANLFIGLLNSIKLIDQNISDAKNQIVPSVNM